MSIDKPFWNRLDIESLDGADKTGNLGAVLLASCPGLRAHSTATDSDIKDDVERLAAAGADFVLSLIEADDRTRLGVTALDDMIAAVGLENASFPIRDHGVPPKEHTTELEQLLDGVEARIRNGKTIVIHCQAGLGRTGMIAGILLRRFGIDGETAIKTIRQIRLGSIETSAQEDFVKGWG